MRLQTVFTLRQPLSHIGESESATVFLNTVKIVSDGVPVDVFAYNGNALRGALRDCAARHLLTKLRVKVKKQMFNILFSGGNISGSLSNDVDQARKYRELVPMISLFGAGVGNQILAGKITQGFALPVCSETTDIIPINADVDTNLFNNSWRKMTGTISFNRTDDLKNSKLTAFADLANDKEKDKKDAQQMRYEVEYYAAGTQLYHEMELSDLTNRELGAFVAALSEFAKNPVLGGMGSKGFGLVDADISFADTGDQAASITSEDGLELCSYFQNALEEYEAFLALNRADIVEFIGGTDL